MIQYKIQQKKKIKPSTPWQLPITKSNVLAHNSIYDQFFGFGHTMRIPNPKLYGKKKHKQPTKFLLHFDKF